MSLFDPIQQLKLSDTFYNWWETTNDISAALNPLKIYDVAAGAGIRVTRLTGGTAVLSVDVGCGLRHDANVSLTLDIQNLPEVTVPDEQDNYIIELANSTNTTPSAYDCETFRRVEATNILPLTVAGDHDFTGGTSSKIDISSTNFTVSSTNTHFKDNSIKLGNVASTSRSAISSVGFFIDALDEDPTLVYRGDLLAWYTNQNIGISYDQAFVSSGPSGNTTAKFNFSPKGATQVNTEINLLLGSRTTEIVTTDTDEAISIKAINATTAFDVSYTSTAGKRTSLFYTRFDGSSDVLFYISGKIYIENIQNSTQFLTSSDYSQYKVPLTTSNGIVDYKYTNRHTSTSYEGSIVAGDVVRFNGTQYARAQANSDSNSQIFGIVERISGGKIWIALTGLVDTTSLTAGTTYYLSQTLPGKITSTKPTTGIVKPVLVGVSTTVGLINSSSSAATPSFANVQIYGGDLVNADSVSDTLILHAGSNITLTKNTNNEILISAGSLSSAQYFKTIDVDVGSDIVAATSDATLRITGERGITTYSSSGNLVIRGGKSFSTVQIIGMNTNELDYTVQAVTGEDTLYLRSGVGINITSSTDNDILIEATGVSVPADGSVTNTILANMHAFSIKAAQGDGEPVDVFDASNRLYAGGYIVTGTGEVGDPQIYTENRSGGAAFTSIVSISGDTVLATAPNEDIAGYAYGRWTDEVGNVSNIIPLGRTELRSIIGAAPTGFLEENANLFNAWYLYENDNETEINHATAGSKTGNLNFVAGNNITLSRAVAVGPDNQLGIRIDASSALSGFNSIINNRNGHNIQSGDTNGVLEITDLDAIAVEVDSNNGLSFSIKSESITNQMLANMPVNTVKASVNSTNDPNPIDLEIGVNQVLGRTTGHLKSLTSTELKQILGLTSSFYFNTISLQDSGGTTVSGSTITAASGAESFALRSGSNISISKVSGQNTYEISSIAGNTTGLTRIAFVDIGGDALTVDNPSTLQFGLVNLTYPLGFGATGNYTNIDYIPASNTGTVAANIDLAPMPQFSVKIASNTFTTRHGSTVFPATNLVLNANEILYRGTSSTSLIGRTLQQIAAQTGGIPYINAISDGTTPVSVSGFGTHTLSIRPGSLMTVVPSYDSVNKITQFTLNSITSLITDTNPTLGADLDMNGSGFKGGEVISTRILSLSQSYATASSLFHFLLTHSDAASTITLGRTLGIATTRDLTISGFGTTSNVVIDRLKSNTNTTFTLTSGSTSGVALTTRHISLESGLAGEVIIGPTTAKDVTFVAGTFSTTQSKDIRNRFYNTTSLIGDIVHRAQGINIGILGTNTGNIILAANTGPLTNGVIPTAGSGSIQFNSDILLSAKSIKAVDNNITVDTVTNDFTGSLKLKATNKSGFHRVKNGQRVNGTASTKILETVSTTSNTEKFAKYMLYMQDALSPTSCAVVEFDVLANGTIRALKTVSVMVSDVTNDFSLAINGSTGEYEIVLLSSVGGTITGNPGETVTGPQPVSLCNSPNPSEGANTFLIQFHNCLLRDYNYTLYKMSIEA